MEKEQKEMWENWESWKGFDDWLNSELEEEYLGKGLIPPFTDPYDSIFSKIIPRQYLEECRKDNCILVKMTKICWEFDTNLERKTYTKGLKAVEFDFLKEAIVQIDLDLSLKIWLRTLVTSVMS